MNAFAQHYIIAALWSTNDESNDQGGEPLEDNYSAADLAPEALASIEADCARFERENAALLAQAYKLYRPHPDAPTPECSAGHDFWFTRNGHGVGFWDRGLGDVGQALTAACHVFGTCDIYVGDDGKLYVA